MDAYLIHPYTNSLSQLRSASVGVGGQSGVNRIEQLCSQAAQWCGSLGSNEDVVWW